MKLKISDTLALPLDVVTSTLVVYGGKGMGKTNFGSVLVEELSKAGLRWAVLDPLGVWWGLRHAQDGKGPGIECLILGGAHGDIPIEPTGGAVVADLVVDEPASVIIDFSRKPGGEMWGIGEKTRFITEYALRLFQRQGELVDGRRREPIFQILDEAARYIPQMVPAGDPGLAKCLSAWNTLVEEGRNVGIGVGLLTQRSARMNKSVSELADAMLSFRIVGPNSIAAVTDWLGEHVAKDRMKQHVEVLRSLERGRCLVVSPGWLRFEGVVMIRERETFDSSATPKPGEKARRVTGAAAKPDLAKYSERMKETIERAKENDPAALKRRIAELERAARMAKPAVVDPEATRNAQAQAVMTAIEKRDEAWSEQLREYQRNLAAALHHTLMKAVELPSLDKPLLQHVRAAQPKLSQNLTVLPVRTMEVARAGTGAARPAAAPLDDDPKLMSDSKPSKPQRKILSALAEAEAIGRTPIGRTWLAFLAGVSPLSSGFEKNVSKLRTSGYVEYAPGSMVMLTQQGRAAAPAIESPMTTEELLDRICGLLSSPQAKLLRILHSKHPAELSREELAERSEVSALSSGFEKNISTLSSRDLVTYPARGYVRAADWLFEHEGVSTGARR